MKYIFLSLLICISACGKKENSSKKKPQTPPLVVEPLPENSPGVTVTEDVAQRVITAIIPASKKYNPTVFEDGFLFLPQDVNFILPETLPVIGGRPGNHLSFVTVDIAAGGSLKCVYLGRGSNTAVEYNSPAGPYHFDFCADKSVSITPSNRSSIKATSQNILDASVRSSSRLNLERGDKITVSVNNSNRNGSQNITGVVRAEFQFEF